MQTCTNIRTCIYIHTLVAVVICFFLCWAPFHAQRLMAIYGSDIVNSESGDDVEQHLFIYTVLTYISGVLYFLSTCVNPILYNLMSNKFRQAFKVRKYFVLLPLFI